MKNAKHFYLSFLAVTALTLSGCLHIVEELTVKSNGSGSYTMTLDMSEMKSMMDMFQGMASDSTDAADGAEAEADSGMGEMGTQLSAVAQSLEGISGITNIQEINDTSLFKFGYSFDFADINALNKAMRIINKEKYESKVDEVFKFSGKNFERLSTGDLGEEIKKAMAEGEAEDEEGSMEMVKTFFSDMSYKQIYNFPDRRVKKSSNELSEVSNDGHTLTITLKPFDESVSKQSVGTKVKLKN
ncbi:MAG: hypothetical protein EP344_05785 [Bacteroidetes bacterium]|nr:MAG: hypothetical protein EP344_05785 [Bacteroidota bacterium]